MLSVLRISVLQPLKTIEAQEKVAIQIAEQISDLLLTGAVNNAINAPSISAEEAQLLGPYLQLA